jgi:hypothetical protein
MKLEDQVVSLQLAQKLKQLGVKQESCFVWDDHTQFGEGVILTFCEPAAADNPVASAFTVAELGLMLPMEISNRNGKYDDCYFETIRIAFKKWIFAYYKKRTARALQLGDTEADARAKMLIHLLENKIVTTTPSQVSNL